MDYILSVIYFNDEKSMLSLSNKPIGFTYVLDTEHVWLIQLPCRHWPW